jgi:hypothetical protein
MSDGVTGAARDPGLYEISEQAPEQAPGQVALRIDVHIARDAARLALPPDIPPGGEADQGVMP